jgi:predicted HTH domain antitoxin
MSTFTLEVQVPDALRETGMTPEEMKQEVPFLLVIKSFREHNISAGKAAEILGITYRAFLDLLAKEGIPLYDPTEQEFEEEMRTVRRHLAPRQE